MLCRNVHKACCYSCASNLVRKQWRIYIVKFWTRPRSNFLHFMQFSAKFGQIIGRRPPPVLELMATVWKILDPPLVNKPTTRKWPIRPPLSSFILNQSQLQFFAWTVLFALLIYNYIDLKKLMCHINSRLLFSNWNKKMTGVSTLSTLPTLSIYEILETRLHVVGGSEWSSKGSDPVWCFSRLFSPLWTGVPSRRVWLE